LFHGLKSHRIVVQLPYHLQDVTTLVFLFFAA
jgi:hypothetical protein